MKKDRIDAAKSLAWEQLGFFNGVICSPLRQDKKPSLSLYSRDNKSYWKDQATGEGGSIIDFVMQWRGLTFPEAILLIEKSICEGKYLQAQTPTSPIAKPTRKSADVDFSICPFKDDGRDYLVNIRGIAAEDLVGVEFYTLKIKLGKYENTYVAFPIDSELDTEAFECRAIEPSNRCKQRKIGAAGLWQHGTGNNVIITESIIDALSYRSLSPFESDATFISLNSVVNWKKLANIDFMGRQVSLCFDNDQTGDTVTQQVVGMLRDKGISVADGREIIKGYKDVNEKLCRP